MLIKWGAEIAVNGRPEWLRDDDTLQIKFPDSGGWINANAAKALWHYLCRGHAIRLPADHPYYTATERGFTYWPGGDSAPADWDGGGVLFRNGFIHSGNRWNWAHTANASPTGTHHIIGYRKRALPVAESLPVAPQPEGDIATLAQQRLATYPDFVAVKAMTESEALARFTYGQMLALKELGIIREESRAEKFTRETGIEVTPDIARALEWAA